MSSSAQVRRQVWSAVADAMLEAYPFDEDSTVVMDYACGSGALSQRIAPFCKSIVGVDINPSSINQYNVRVAEQGIFPEEMRAICLDLLQDPLELEGKKFDVIVCSQAYHHFPSIDKTTEVLSSFLKSDTGILLASDLLKGPHAHEFHRSQHAESLHTSNLVVHPGGLNEDDIRSSFEKAGLVDIKLEVIYTVEKDSKKVDIFLIQGRRSSLGDNDTNKGLK